MSAIVAASRADNLYCVGVDVVEIWTEFLEELLIVVKYAVVGSCVALLLGGLC